MLSDESRPSSTGLLDLVGCDDQSRSLLAAYQANERYYNPFVGRFTSEDPARQASGDINLQTYVGDNPINRTDPSGQDAKDQLPALTLDPNTGNYYQDVPDPDHPGDKLRHWYSTTWSLLGWATGHSITDVTYLGHQRISNAPNSTYDQTVQEYSTNRMAGIHSAAMQIGVTTSEVATLVDAYFTATMVVDAAELAVLLSKAGYEIVVDVAGKRVLSLAGKELSEAETKAVLDDLAKQTKNAGKAAKSARDLAREIPDAAADALKTGSEAARDALSAEDRALAANNYRQIGNMNTSPNSNVVKGFQNARADWLEGKGPWPGANANAWAKANGIK